ncbi:hypothetical protein [Streptomyces sp. MMBL 11-1]|uniref:hypothetical protein n=1 Tax=Streptomyces sp. MMBL 11-1 TaxID=3026420 RepID=UPI00235FB099|nr:hypothetical protein [Streptomyces sp. MMBL 11-1]
MGELRVRRLVPTGICFCGCGSDAEIGRWFVRGHDITASAALRALEGTGLAQRLVAAGYGPERSVVGEAVARAGWVRCAGCAYAGSTSGLAAHVRGGGCAGAGRAVPGRPAATVTAVATTATAAATHAAGAEAATRAGAGARGERGSATGVLAEGETTGESGRRRRRRAGGEDTGPVLAGAGPGRGLLLPGSGDMVWKKVPLHLRVHLAGAAYRLVTPEQQVLREKKNREVKFAVRAAGSKRATGRHWLVLLSSPRESFGSARSEKADRVYEVLQQIVAEYVAPAVGKTAAEGPGEPGGTERTVAEGPGVPEGAEASGVLPAAGGGGGEGALTAEPEPETTPAAGRGASSGGAGPSKPGSVRRVEGVAGAARGLLLPAQDDPSWSAVPLPLRQSLRMSAHHLVTPVPGPLKAKRHRGVLAAVRAAKRMRVTGAHWLVLLTTERETFGNGEKADRVYEVLEQIVAECVAPAVEKTKTEGPAGAADEERGR